MQSIELKVGGNSIKIDMTGIKIKGMQIDVSADAKLSTKGLLVEHKGDGPMTIQAPLIKIN
jgi:type VI secretion system secreted protein VgrG